jgi:hypothetical protein
MLRQPLRLFGETAGIDPLDGFDEPGVKRSPPIREQRPVGHVVRQCVLERVLGVGKELDLVQEFGPLQTRQRRAQGRLIQIGDGGKQSIRRIFCR